MGIPSSSIDSALQIVQSFTSPVLADPSGCLPVRATSSSARKGIPVPSMPRYKVCGRETASRASVCTRSSSAISSPRASAVLSTCLASTATPASSVNSSLPSWKLTMATTVPTMRVRAGESEVFSMPRCPSRGQKPCPQEELQARCSCRGPRTLCTCLPPTSDPARFLPASTTSSRAPLIAGVGVETLLNRGSRQLQNLLSHGELQRFQIQVFHRLTPEERLNLLNDVAAQ